MLATLEPLTQPQHTRETLLADVLPWLILLLGLVIVGGVIILWIRRSISATNSLTAGDTGFTLYELRELHRKGELSNEEFERAREAIIGSFQAKDEPAPPPAASDNDK